MARVHHRSADIDGLTVFYREAGAPEAPALVLLHGYPTSSHMFRHLIPRLAERFHVIAPDHIGFGFSSAPPVDRFDYTFDALAEVTRTLLDRLEVTRYAIYVQDYGAPIGWRLALADPGAIVGVISQNGNAYEEGFVPAFWAPIWAHAEQRDVASEAALLPALGREAVEWQYTHGEPDVSLVDPDAWEHDLALLARPGVPAAQLALFADYATNPPLYPRVHDWLRENEVPVLAVWGRNDEIFAPAGASAFAKDSPAADVVLLDGGHFVLETHLDEVTEAILTWADRHSISSARIADPASRR